MSFARWVRNIPTPMIFAWNASKDNPVCVPYILQEYLDNVVEPWRARQTTRVLASSMSRHTGMLLSSNHFLTHCMVLGTLALHRVSLLMLHSRTLQTTSCCLFDCQDPNHRFVQYLWFIYGTSYGHFRWNYASLMLGLDDDERV
jgi:hypothetical protein